MKARLIFICLFLVSGGYLYAQIAVTPVLIDINNATDKTKKIASELLKVKNSADHNEYVKITPRRVLFPGKSSQKYVAITNPRQEGIYVSPTKLVIPAKSQRTVKVSLLGVPTKEEKIYRIKVAPMAIKEIAKKKGRNVGVQMLIGYDVLVIRRPLNPHAIITVNRVGPKITIHNNGNSNALIYNTEQCVAGKCTDLHKTRRIYAGASFSFQAPNAAPVSFTEQFMKKRRAITSN
jgi:P pilus assembly chaperone PapD